MNEPVFSKAHISKSKYLNKEWTSRKKNFTGIGKKVTVYEQTLSR